MMELTTLTGYPYVIQGPAWMYDVGYSFHGTDIPPTGADYLCDYGDAQEQAAYIVLMGLPEPPDDLPEGWTVEPFDMDDTWSSDDGTWKVKAIHQKADGSWIFAGYCR